MVLEALFLTSSRPMAVQQLAIEGFFWGGGGLASGSRAQPSADVFLPGALR